MTCYNSQCQVLLNALIWKRVCNNKTLIQYENWFPYTMQVWIVPLSCIHPSFMLRDNQVMIYITILINDAKRKHKIYFAPTWSSYLYSIDVDMINEHSLQCLCWKGDSMHVTINMLHIFIPFMYETPIVDIFEFRCSTSYSKVHP